MHNGWPVSACPPLDPGGVRVAPVSGWPPGGRGRGFAPGRGRGAWAASAFSDDRPGPLGVNGNAGACDRNCFKCGGSGHLSHNCPSALSNRNGVTRNERTEPVTHWGDVNGQGHVSNGFNGHVRHTGQGHGQRIQNGHRNKVTEGCYKCGRDGHRARDCTNQCNGHMRLSQSDKVQTSEVETHYDPEESLEENLFSHGVSSGINFSNYKNINVDVTGSDVPQKVSAFAEASLYPVLLGNISRSKYSTPTPVQEYAIPIIMAGRDLMACAQTGSGKTAAFLIPIIQNLFEQKCLSRGSLGNSGYTAPEVVIMSPTRELAGQIKDEARKFCNGSEIRCVAAYGGTSVSRLADKLEDGCNILVATPGRLCDFYRRGKVSFSRVKFLVLDEADRMLDMGFKEEMDQILHNDDLKSHSHQTLLFSATYPADIQKIAQGYLNNYIFLAVGVVGGACEDVEQAFLQVTHFEKREKLLEVLTPIKTLVFVEAKKTADFIASYLCQSEHPATSIHGDRLQPEREKALKDFKSNRKPILVATAVAARGLDIEGVEHVINYDLPKTVEEYVHRIGRTGRLGNTGAATSFYDPRNDCGLASGLMKILMDSKQVSLNNQYIIYLLSLIVNPLLIKC